MSALVAGSNSVDLFENRTTHASRTLMVSDLITLLDSVPQGTSEEYRRAILEENVLQKKSASARSKTKEHLRALYFLDNGNTVFSALSTLAAEDPGSVPMLAMLCGATRDVLLRSTAELVLNASPEAVISSEDLRRAVEEKFPDRFSENTLMETGRRALSSWAQSGHLAEDSKYARKKAASGNSPPPRGSACSSRRRGRTWAKNGHPPSSTAFSRRRGVRAAISARGCGGTSSGATPASFTTARSCGT